MRLIIACASALVCLPGIAAAQNHDHAQHSEYAAIRDREVKALDSATIANYRSGAGMGYALAGELNGFPGPRHVLDLAGQLGLSEQQRARTTEIFRTMQGAAVGIGEQIIELERELDRRFSHRHIDAATLEDLTTRTGTLNGRLRAVHLKAHLEVTSLLTESQIRRYNELRGYAPGG